MGNSVKPIQKILFGSPGTGKSYQVREIAQEQLGIEFDEDTKILKNTVKTVFHPEYTYSDFVGKLLPYTYGNSVVYKYYPGHFLQALGKAYRGLIKNPEEKYLLVIDELNRGNAAAIFGSIFQLLDRENDGWSTYEVDISELEMVGLFNAMDYKANITGDGVIQVEDIKLKIFFREWKNEVDKYYYYDYYEYYINGVRMLKNLENKKISIPPNLSIIATINTSDESIYYLDSALKRRWDWEYVDAPSQADIKNKNVPDIISQATLELDNGEHLKWYRCIVGINEFIKSHHQSIRRVEDKQMGWWFIKPHDGKVSLDQVKDKVMFYLWDSVFARDKRPLVQLFTESLNNINLTTYADFVMHAEELIKYMHDSMPALEYETEF
ncbi:MAG: AAA family ATPase [Coleofasciculus sp. D1-CHI-01]|uniref:McrB family protein n=1 Tax=Coleofasciculus sp. D1-CHI-01 TaxID=3068482 RepID=UPI003300E09B